MQNAKNLNIKYSANRKGKAYPFVIGMEKTSSYMLHEYVTRFCYTKNQILTVWRLTELKRLSNSYLKTK